MKRKRNGSKGLGPAVVMLIASVVENSPSSRHRPKPEFQSASTSDRKNR
jgi:hypothetical protein